MRLAVKATAEVVPSCRVCGGAVNSRGECVVCGTKQTDPQTPAADKNLASWLKGDSNANGLSAWIGAPVVAPAADPNAEALRKWLAGEDAAFQAWLGVSSARVGSSASAGPQPVPQDVERELRAKAMEIDGLRAELDAMKATVARELGTLRTGRFDPVKYIEETASLSKQLLTEIAKRKELEEEIEHIKKGSIAVIKYMKAQQVKVGPAADLRKKLEQEAEAKRKLEVELNKSKEVAAALQKQVEQGLAELRPDDKALKARELALLEREASLNAKEAVLGQAAAGEHASEELERRFEEELRTMEQDYLAKEDAFKKRIISLEEALNKQRIEDQLRAESQALSGKPKAEIDGILAKKEQELLAKEKSILLREQEIKRLQDEVDLKEDELRKLKEPLAFKEDELLRREEDLQYREKLLDAERRKVEEAKALGGSIEEMELKRRLEDLKGQINQKEEEVRTKERYLSQKLEELRQREQGLVQEDLEAREQERQIEFKQEKVRTGISRLDDLLYGGVPFGSNVSIYGPAYIGKEVVVNLFIAEGLKKGFPAIWVLTDKAPSDIREEMTFVLPSYEEYEKLGLVRYVDAYSKSIGAEARERDTTYIDEPTDHQKILKAVDTLAAELKKKYSTYRLAFRSVSTLIAYLDPTTAFKFLQPFVGRRKRDRAVAFFVIEKGMHEEQEIQMLGSLMDGSVEFKVEQLKSFMSIKGICDVQSRNWIRYTYTKSNVTIGSFSLDHIK